MKKRIFVLISFLILISVFSPAVIAEEETAEKPFRIEIENAECSVGDTVFVKMYVFDNPGIISINMTMEYDNEKLELIEVKDGGILGKEIMHKNEKTSPFIFSWANYTTDQNTRQTFNENGVLCTMKFRVKGGKTGDTFPLSLILPDYAVMDFDLNEIPTTATNGSITVKEGKSAVMGALIGISAAAVICGGILYYILSKKKTNGK